MSPYPATSSWLPSFWLITLGFLTLCDAEFCFRKIHEADKDAPGGKTCRGLIDKHIFPTSRACCESKDGQGFARELVSIGRRKRKWKCIPCPTNYIKPILAVNSTGWSSWDEWSACSATCAVGTKRRERLCQGSIAVDCNGDRTEQEQCWDIIECPIDGGWGPWNSWSGCTEPCGGGQRQRMRLCNNPVPESNGRDCGADRTEIKVCNSHGCPVDGGWSNWGDYGVCDVTCGRGKAMRHRTCTEPEPKHGGNFCIGSSKDVSQCDTNRKCPIDGQWSLWSTFSSCSITCGKGLTKRTRLCVAPSPRNGGKECLGNSTESQPCYSHNPCPVNGEWTSWTDWGMCLARPCSNETGIQTRTRTCSNPQPRFRGKLCSGTTTDTQTCYHNNNCSVNGQWCNWEPYSECRLATNNINFRTRVRQCLCPMPMYGGNTCVGEDYQLSNCLVIGEKRSLRTGCKFVSLLDRLEGSGYFEDDDDC
ncbi:coadhesin-like [Watersipora subatra]|uniref:coadhesin-like n=1 Tax=Watersipora subatra TaxID=2589382 RepID=UPI00355B0E71